MADVFRALADPSRRRLLDRLHADNGQTLASLCAGLDMARQSVSKHLAVLEDAGLVTTRRHGREKFHYLDAGTLHTIAMRWLSKYDQARADALHDLTSALEGKPMTTNAFAYTTYIRSTPEKVWRALTEPAFTKRYWGAELKSDWTPGAPIGWTRQGTEFSPDDSQQVVLEADPYRVLAYTWHAITPEFAKVIGVDEEERARLDGESRSKVRFEIEDQGELVQLRVLHDGFDESSSILPGISEGWPAILSSLKTLLETGEVLPEPSS
ncbi:ArsR/SmtB family transcription factor [Luteipulveratus mongoliensis]|uniref:ArsR family transcriptional regulator n=1 Tax=Luteipulveratus mongoliensis TaxID=571913 RepID=A0A0K1JEN4_9MICO|nr:metalloregulator ArsR/SmtB family transcription factor [Luteipulveratus mongoliensis]AKU15055.1 ArsR family transcriptional regulator [Luteipulveratus mongoliensis]